MYYPSPMLKYRLIFGPILIALLIGVFAGDYALEQHGWPKGVALLALAALAVGLAGVEFARFLQAKGFPVHTVAVVTAALLGLVGLPVSIWLRDAYVQKMMDNMGPQLLLGASPDLGPINWGTDWGMLPLGLIAVFFLYAIFRHAQKTRNPEGALQVGGAVVLSAVYLGVLTSFLVLLRMDFGLPAAIAIILTTKACDIGAYFTGRALGKTKLIPWISPAKTREGLAGGVLFSALVAVGFQQWVLPDAVLGGGQVLPLCCPITAAVFGAALAILGQGGDLLASMFKRDAGVKDSGNTLPGFGGLIDVLDSPIAVAPLAYLAMKLLACGMSCG